jgi:hypothetical protein
LGRHAYCDCYTRSKILNSVRATSISAVWAYVRLGVDPSVWHGLQDNDRWQSGYLKGDELAEIEFWLGDDSASKPEAGGVRSVSSA